MDLSVFSLVGRRALVTGNGTVPAEIARMLREAGAEVMHAADPALDETTLTELVEAVDGLDILVNGLVRIGAWPLDDLSIEEWDRVHAINTRAAFLLMRAAMRVMRKAGRGGRLIALSTIGSLTPVLYGNYAYGASRAGLNALVRQFALEGAAERITANAILVGAIPSDPFPPGCPMPPQGPGMQANRFPMGQGQAGDVAPLALLLASEGGRYITGQAIAVDGGFQVA